MITNPNCFISYSQDNDEHCKWVLKLATDLRMHGVNVVLDQWDLTLGKDLRFFMEQGLGESSFVLCICSEKYVEKVNCGKGGAGYEGMIMTQSLLKNCNQDYVIPIVRNNDTDNKVPICFGSKLYIDFDSDDDYYSNYQKLIEHIYQQDISRKPPLGKNPFEYISTAIEKKVLIDKTKYCSSSMDGSVEFLYENNNHYFLLGTGEYSFNTRWSRCGKNAIYAYGKIGVNQEYSAYPSLSDIIMFDFCSNVRTVRTGEIIVMENEYHHFAAIKIGIVTSTSHGDKIDLLKFDYHIFSAL